MFRRMILLSLWFAGSLAAQGQDPSWWYYWDPGFYTSSGNYNLANQGQAKFLATLSSNCFDRMVGELGGPGTGITARVDSLTQQHNYNLVNEGQLKNLGKIYYDRIYELAVATPYLTNALPPGMPGLYPWTDTEDDDHNWRPANIGQLKYVFSFDFDRDADFMADWWEVREFGSTLAQTWDGDPDMDGTPNYLEFLARTFAWNPDTDGDGANDWMEINVFNTSPTQFNFFVNNEWQMAAIKGMPGISVGLRSTCGPCWLGAQSAGYAPSSLTCTTPAWRP
jgi:hypothetical protein